MIKKLVVLGFCVGLCLISATPASAVVKQAEGAYPLLALMAGSGTVGDPYIITTVTDLQNIENDLTAYYELSGNIDASATATWNANAGFLPITDFTGELDGKGFTITSLTINRAAQKQGLFGQLSGSAVVKNLTLATVSITSTLDFIGALVGWISGSSVTIADCSSSGAVAGDDYIGGLIGYAEAGDFDDSFSSCTVSGDDAVGGFAGNIDGGTVDQCYATGVVTGTDDWVGGFMGIGLALAINKCYATGNVSSPTGRDVGGFIGDLGSTATIDDCYARGSVMGDNEVGGFVGLNYFDGTNVIDDCYSTGAVTGNTNKGGFCGVNDNSITNCFWDTETSGEAADGTGGTATGKTTAQMKTQSTFTDAGWDFTTPIWYISSGVNNGYPSFTAPPTVTTQAVSGIGFSSATGNGNITSVGSETCDERGFDWDIDSDAPYANSQTDTGTFSTGAFTRALTGLSAGDTIYCRAKAHSVVGWAYGAEVSFATLPRQPADSSVTGTLSGGVLIVWEKGDGADNTTIRSKLWSAPVDVSDGTLVYDGTGEEVTDTTEYSQGDRIYYCLWSSHTDNGTVVYSSNASCFLISYYPFVKGILGMIPLGVAVGMLILVVKSSRSLSRVAGGFIIGIITFIVAHYLVEVLYTATHL